MTMKVTRSWVYISVALGALFADGSIQTASAQCSPNDKLYIDPRLVPQTNPAALQGIIELLVRPDVDPSVKDLARQQYMRAVNPIEMPYTGGKVLISPQNPCIQQFIPN